jgi:hypothetical protein
MLQWSGREARISTNIIIFRWKKPGDAVNPSKFPIWQLLLENQPPGRTPQKQSLKLASFHSESDKELNEPICIKIYRRFLEIGLLLRNSAFHEAKSMSTDLKKSQAL